MSIEKAIEAITAFQGDSLTKSLSMMEESIVGANALGAADFCCLSNIDDDFIDSALIIKKFAGQTNVIIHASGILHSLKDILEDGEVVESVSLGAGNTGRMFDLETNKRVAEFKFIDWQGGPETIRQNSIFKDFYELAEYDTKKRKYLYVVDTYYPLKFLNGNRKIDSVLSRLPTILSELRKKYGDNMKVVSDYYNIHRENVVVEDVSTYIGRA